MISRFRANLDVELSIRTLFETPTVAGLAQGLGEAQGAQPPLRPLPRPQDIPLSYSQRRMWFLNRLEREGQGRGYTIPVGLRLEGTLDVVALEAALCDVMVRHESLRTIFPEREGIPQQVILEPQAARLKLSVTRVSDEELGAALGRAVGDGFDLCREVPLRAHVFKLSPQDACAAPSLTPHCRRRLVAGAAAARYRACLCGAAGGRRAAAYTVAGAICRLHPVAARCAGGGERARERLWAPAWLLARISRRASRGH